MQNDVISCTNSNIPICKVDFDALVSEAAVCLQVVGGLDIHKKMVVDV